MDLLSGIDFGDDEDIEIEVSYESETAILDQKSKCKKRDQHKNFIPVNEFNMELLPEPYRYQNLVDLIRALAGLTVYLRISKTSPNRPKPPYPPVPRFNKYGAPTSFHGTGWVKRVERRTEKEDKPCLCRECKNSPSPQKEWGHIEIMTVAHVVHDEMEAENTTCFFDYDLGADLDRVVSLNRIGGFFKDVKDDLSMVLLCSHDMDFVDKLRQREHLYRTLQKKVMDKYRTNEDEDSENDADDDEEKNPNGRGLTVIISHPHGESKKISVGELQQSQLKDDDENICRYFYSAATCPGSSGAPVFLLAKGSWYDEHPHSGSSAKSGFNRSAYAHF